MTSTTHTVHAGDLPYARPVVRPPSPTGSINTEYGPDETDPIDLVLSDEEFERRVLAELRINEPTENENWSDSMPIRFPVFQAGSHEERVVYQHTLFTLRKRVEELEEDEMFLNIVHKGSQAQLDAPLSTNNIDAIMQSMMSPPAQSAYRAPRFREDIIMGETDAVTISAFHKLDVFGRGAGEKGKGKEQ